MNVASYLKEKRRRIVKIYGHKLMLGFEKLIATQSLVETTPVIDAKHFPWAAELEENWQVIRKELDKLLAYVDVLPSFHDISNDQKVISKGDTWKTYFFYGMGYKAEKNCSHCPETTRMLEQIPGMLTAFFSILLPGTHIPKHRGLFNGLVRYHLALKVPEPPESCWIDLNGEILHWEEGKGIFFDDTFPHEVKNESNDIRVVLFLDIVRPTRQPAALLNGVLHKLVQKTAFIRKAKENQDMWEERLEQHMAAASA